MCDIYVKRVPIDDRASLPLLERLTIKYGIGTNLCLSHLYCLVMYGSYPGQMELIVKAED